MNYKTYTKSNDGFKFIWCLKKFACSQKTEGFLGQQNFGFLHAVKKPFGFLERQTPCVCLPLKLLELFTLCHKNMASPRY